MDEKGIVKPHYQIIIFFVFLMCGCNRDHENPFDPNTTTTAGQVSQLCVKALSEKILEISWKPARNSIGTRIYKKQLEEIAFESLDELPSDSTHYYDRAVKLNCTYIYKVISFNARSEAALEITFNHSFLAPTNVSVEQVSPTCLQVRWDDNTTFEKGFLVERRAISSTNYLKAGTVDENHITFLDNSVELGINYIYRVAAFTNFTKSFSDSITFSNIIYCPDSLKAQQISENEIELIWRDRCSFEDEFIIERADSGTTGFRIIGHASKNAKSFSDCSVVLGNIYYYRIQTSALSKFSDYSESVLIQHMFTSPALLKSTHFDSTSVKLEWMDRSSIETDFEIEQQVNEGNWYLKGVVEKNITSFISRGLSHQNIYSYRVKAKGITHMTEPTNEVEVKYSANWIKQDVGEISLNYKCIQFTSKDIGYIGGEGGMIKTIDAGENWKELEGAKGFYRFKDMHFVNDLDGWAVGHQHDPQYLLADVVAKTEDGGNTWIKMPLAQISTYSHYSAIPSCVFAFDKRSAIIGGLWEKGLDDGYSRHGFYAKTTNSGEDWIFTFKEMFYIPTDIQFYNSTRGIATCTNNRFITKDGGKNWIDQFDNYASNMGSSSICLINPNLAWTTDNFQLLKSVDAGETWHVSWNGGEGHPRYIFFIDANNGWVLANDVIFETEDGGNNWQKMPSPAGLKIQCLYFTEKSKGWAAGDAGAILRTKNLWTEIN